MKTRSMIVALVLMTMTAVAGAQNAPRPDADPRIEKVVASISEERLKELLTKLVSFGTRNTLSDQTSATSGIGAARNWILEEMRRSSEKLRVNFDTHTILPQGRITREVDLRNVMAILPGRSPRRIYISGHYDSVNIGGQNVSNSSAPGATTGGDRQTRPEFNPNVEANGANDDGSGTVLTMELARVFAESGIEFDATLVFITVAGEEQGLVGSTAHAKKAKASNVPIQAVFNNDIVGNSTGGNGIVDGSSIRIYSEGPEDSPSRALAQFTRRVAASYVPSHRVRLIARRDRFSRGGDHTGYNSAGFAAIGFRESRENYAKQHNARDTIDGVSFPYLAQNARVNAAAMATLALAPPPPVVASNMISRQPSGYDARLRWTASPGAAGYRIFWREAWAPDWEHELFVGSVTEFIFPGMNIDDHVFGVAAVSAGGHESTISAYVMAPRTDDDR